MQSPGPTGRSRRCSPMDASSRDRAGDASGPDKRSAGLFGELAAEPREGGTKQPLGGSGIVQVQLRRHVIERLAFEPCGQYRELIACEGLAREFEDPLRGLLRGDVRTARRLIAVERQCIGERVDELLEARATLVPCAELRRDVIAHHIDGHDRQQVKPPVQSRSASDMGAPVRIGDVLADKYKVTGILGSGGMGVVVAARHCELEKLVALKFIHEEVSSNEHITERFLREARAAARLRNEHVVDVLDVGRLPNGVPYIVMEYLEGQDLGQLVERRGPLEVADAVEYVLQVCEAMAEAHAQGIIHRDLKPQNLFLTTQQDGRPLVKVLDFGISKAPFSQNPTSTSQAMGSPSYMAPEQIRSSRSVDARADIWSLGVILYQLLSNTLPFVGDTGPEVMFKVLSESPPPLASVRGGLPPALVIAIDRCLEKDRERRFANVAELAHELVPFTPERARAAISLIERVMMAGAPQPRASMPDAELAAVVPGGEATDEVVPGSMSRSPMETTLGTAVSSVAIGAGANPRRWWWVALVASGVAATAIIAVIATRGSASSPSTASLVTTVVTTLDAGAVTDAAQPGAAPGAPLGAPPEPVVDALPDAMIDTSPDTPIDARVRPRTTRHKIEIDAGGPPAPEPQTLEPARTDDKPLSPAR
ncbi:MAG: serine/threonine protein kinase [Deltaproteobacteria bacterium]|nr:MAG: serine/threonine protein kinase [Deltaproteobacteria bacterium]